MAHLLPLSSHLLILLSTNYRYDRYGGLAFSYAYHLLRERNAAEDVVHAAILNVWHRAATYDAQHGVARIWLLTIVHHQAITRGTRSWGQ